MSVREAVREAAEEDQNGGILSLEELDRLLDYDETDWLLRAEGHEGESDEAPSDGCGEDTAVLICSWCRTFSTSFRTCAASRASL